MALFDSPPSYEHLRVFGCTCYPNTSSTTPHKLSPRSTRCVFLGYSSDHKGYHCLDLSTNRLIVSRHVVFDEASFPLAASPHLTDLDFLCELGSLVNPIRTPLTTAGTTTPTACQPAPVVPPGLVPQVSPLTTPAVPPGFQPRAVSRTSAAPRAAPDSTAGPRADPTSTVAPHVALTSSFAPYAVYEGSPPCEWPASPMVYTRCTTPTASTAPESAPAPTLSPPPLPRRPPGSEATMLPITPPVNPHRMATRAKYGFQMATKPFTFTASTPSLIPSSVRATLADPNWCAAMKDEYEALMSNRT
jgi:hypothetical protein